MGMRNKQGGITELQYNPLLHSHRRGLTHICHEKKQRAFITDYTAVKLTTLAQTTTEESPATEVV